MEKIMSDQWQIEIDEEGESVTVLSSPTKRRAFNVKKQSGSGHKAFELIVSGYTSFEQDGPFDDEEEEAVATGETEEDIDFIESVIPESVQPLPSLPSKREIQEELSSENYFVKNNKHNHFRFSIQETITTVFWNILLPENSSQVDLVFNKSNKISGVVSPGIADVKPLSRQQQLNGDNIDYRSLAAVLVGEHVFCEDDAHRKNILVREENGIFKFFHIDFDMSFQRLAEAGIAGLEQNRRFVLAPRPNHFQIHRNDCCNLPFFKYHQAHYAPGTSNYILNGDVASIFPGVLSEKGYESSWFKGQALPDELAKLKDNEEFIKWKWYYYLKYLLMSEADISQKIDQKLSGITDPEELKVAHELKQVIIQENLERQEKFRQELLQIPAFIETLNKNREEFTQLLGEECGRELSHEYDSLIRDSQVKKISANFFAKVAKPAVVSPKLIKLSQAIGIFSKCGPAKEKIDIAPIPELQALIQKQRDIVSIHELVASFKINLLGSLNNDVSKYDNHRQEINKIDEFARESIISLKKREEIFNFLVSPSS